MEIIWRRQRVCMVICMKGASKLPPSTELNLGQELLHPRNANSCQAASPLELGMGNEPGLRVGVEQGCRAELSCSCIPRALLQDPQPALGQVCAAGEGGNAQLEKADLRLKAPNHSPARSLHVWISITATRDGGHNSAAGTRFWCDLRGPSTWCVLSTTFFRRAQLSH